MKPAVNFEDRAEVADWFSAVMDSAYDLAEIAGAALKPKDERVVAKAELRRELDATFAELRQLCRAGRRGIRTPTSVADQPGARRIDEPLRSPETA